MVIYNSHYLLHPTPSCLLHLEVNELTQMVIFNLLIGPEGRVQWCVAGSEGSQVVSHQDIRRLYSRRSCKYLGSISSVRV